MTSQGGGGDGGYDDPGMKSGVETPDRFAAPYDPSRPSPKKSPEAFTKKLDQGLHEVQQHQRRGDSHHHHQHSHAHHAHPPNRRMASRRDDIHVQQDSSTSDTNSDLTEKTRAMQIDEGQDELGRGYAGRLNSGTTDLNSSTSMLLHPRARSRSRSRSRSVTRGVMDQQQQLGGPSRTRSRSISTRRLKSSSRSRTRAERTVAGQTETPNESEKDTEREDNGDKSGGTVNTIGPMVDGDRDGGRGRPGRGSRTTSSASTVTIGPGNTGTGSHSNALPGTPGQGSGIGSVGEERRGSVDKLRTPRPGDYTPAQGSNSSGGGGVGLLLPGSVVEEEEEDDEDERAGKTKAFAFYGEVSLGWSGGYLAVA